MHDTKTAYRRLLQRYHPDVSTEPQAEARFKQIQAAYAGFKAVALARGGVDSTQHPGGLRTAATPAAAAAERTATVVVTLEQAWTGGVVDVHVDLDADPELPEVRNRLLLPVRLPARIQDGERFRVSNVFDGNRDLDLVARYARHSRFDVRGFDVFTRLCVTPWEAVLGALVPMMTLDGSVDVPIQTGTPAGRRIRIAGRGLPKPDGSAGDLYCKVRIVTPPSPTDHERELFRQLAAISRFDPRTDDLR